jgi:hypothetical protein
MFVKHATADLASDPSRQIADALRRISETGLRACVERVAVPRHYLVERAANEDVALWIAAQLQGFGYDVQMQGQWRNVVAVPKNSSGKLVVVGAHYDSVGGCAGADDNASAVAALLECARVCAGLDSPPRVCFVAFNREEDGFLGSFDFVKWLVTRRTLSVTHAHVLEMVGFASDLPGSQQIPSGLPVEVPNTGNFLGLLANGNSSRILDSVLRTASTYVPELPVIGLHVTLGLERFFPVLLRSDHAPFWERQIPATMWTDTSEFRNPYYHQPGDKPHTLNYKFLRAVTQLLLACVAEHAKLTR